MSIVQCIRDDRSGVAAIEYTTMMVGVALAIVLAAAVVGAGVACTLSTVASAILGGGSGTCAVTAAQESPDPASGMGLPPDAQSAVQAAIADPDGFVQISVFGRGVNLTAAKGPGTGGALGWVGTQINGGVAQVVSGDGLPSSASAAWSGSRQSCSGGTHSVAAMISAGNTAQGTTYEGSAYSCQ